MSKVLLLTGTHETAADILPSLSLLDHVVTVGPADHRAVLLGPRDWPARPTWCWSTREHHLVKAKELLGQLARPTWASRCWW